MNIEELRCLFEKWAEAQFDNVCLSRTEDEGYTHDTINTLFIGFCAHAELTK